MVFRFKQFSLQHGRSTMKIGTDAVLLAALTDVQDAQSVLDIGCGCGVISFCLAQQLSLKSVNAALYGVDLDADSIAEAKDNVRSFNLLPQESFHFENSSIQDFSQLETMPKFDLIVSNPPFFDQDLKPTQLSKLKSKHCDGQLSFQELADCVLKLLQDNGRFVVILPVREGAEFDAIISQHLHCTRRVWVKPTEKKPVHRVIQEYSFEANVACQESTVIIRDAQNHYTSDYQRIVEPYLL